VDGLGQLFLLGLLGGYTLSDRPPERVATVEVQAIRPTKADRPLDMTLIDWQVREKRLWDGRVRLGLGATLMHASGQITQLTGSLDDGSLREARLDSPGWGLGPSIGASLRAPMSPAVSVSLDVKGAVLLHDRAFPAGGKRYNGLIEGGPSLHWRLDGGSEVSLGARWLHLSNGQGLGAHNPSYDGRGISLRYRRPL
jgi:hypothetical protein